METCAGWGRNMCGLFMSFDIFGWTDDIETSENYLESIAQQPQEFSFSVELV